MKKALIIIGAVLMLFSLSGCGNDGLVVWSFTDELDRMLTEYYAPHPAHEGFQFTFSLTPTGEFTTKLDPVLQSGRGAPDIFALEAAFVRKYIESGLLLDLTDIYERNRDKLLAYPVEIGTYEGRVYGMSWQAAPGAFFYRRSLARQYLGTDDPAVVQTYFENFDKFLETAELLKTRSNGTCLVLASRGDLYNPFVDSRAQPWVVGGRLVIDPMMERFMELSKIVHDRVYAAPITQWSDGWFAGMRGELRDENGNPQQAFGYFLPTWGLHYVLKTNAPDTTGDWAVIPGPVRYRWGGTWIAAWKDTKRADEAKAVIEWLTTSDYFLERWARDTGDVVSNINVMNNIKDEFSEDFLGGQNHYAMFAELAQGVNGRLVQGTDQAIEGLFQEAVTAYVEGEKTKDEALRDFRAQVESQLGIN
jgi:ABC-type glycerol-3-phosphate transport system substrate-binding protein